MMGRSFTVSEMAVVCSSSKITGSRSASATREAVAEKLRQFLSGLRKDSSHDSSSYSSAPILPRSRACSTTLMNTSSSEKRPSRAPST